MCLIQSCNMKQMYPSTVTILSRTVYILWRLQLEGSVSMGELQLTVMTHSCLRVNIWIIDTYETQAQHTDFLQEIKDSSCFIMSWLLIVFLQLDQLIEELKHCCIQCLRVLSSINLYVYLSKYFPTCHQTVAQLYDSQEKKPPQKNK